jgi:hypothetical protein
MKYALSKEACTQVSDKDECSVRVAKTIDAASEHIKVLNM